MRWKDRHEGKMQRQGRPPLKVLRLDEKAILPTRGTDGSAGYDLYAVNTVTLNPGDIRRVHTGLAMEIPQGFFGHLVIRSSLGKVGVRLSAGTSIIDSDYRGEVMLYIINDGAYPYTIKMGDRCAQMAILPYEAVEVVEVDRLSETQRGCGGFGSTGK